MRAIPSSRPPTAVRLSRALEQLDYMVSVDLYINETTRHANLILPPAWSLTEDHVDLISTNAAVRNVARWSPPAVKRPAGAWSDWQILLELSYRLGGGPTGLRPLDWLYRVGRKLGIHWTPDSTIDLLVRLGPHGDRFLPFSRGLNLKKLKAAPHGIDLGPMQPGIEHRVWHRDRKMHLDVPVLLRAVDDLSRTLDQPPADADSLLLIGRRELRSNNSWMHNVPELVSGRLRCVLLVHPRDAERAGLRDGDTAILENALHRGEVPVRISDEMRPGVVSLPHGWGHAAMPAGNAWRGHTPAYRSTIGPTTSRSKPWSANPSSTAFRFAYGPKTTRIAIARWHRQHGRRNSCACSAIGGLRRVLSALPEVHLAQPTQPALALSREGAGGK